MRRYSCGSGYSVKTIALKDVAYSSDNANILTGKLNEDRTRNKCFCDFTIKTSSHEYPIHKCVLGVMSDFFKKMFTSNMRERYERSATLDGISDNIMEMIIEFIYNNILHLKMNNAYELLGAADYLQMPLLQTYCINYLVQNFSPENAIKFWEAAKLFNSDNFLFDCEAYISKQLMTLFGQKKHLMIDFETMLHFIEIRDSSVSEQCVFEGIISWVEHARVARLEHFSHLFKLIDLTQLSKSYINSAVMTNDLVMECHECSNLLMKVRRDHFPAEQNQSEISQYFSPYTAVEQSNFRFSRSERRSRSRSRFHSRSRSRSIAGYSLLRRIHRDLPAEFILIGGKTSSSYLRKFDVVSKKWSKLPNHPGDIICVGAALVNKVMYLIGGQHPDSEKSYNSLDSWNTASASGDEANWIDKDSMFKARYKFGCAVLNNLIYVAGGKAHKTKWLNSVESYNIRRNKWVERPSMNYNRGECCLVELEGQLCALGGCQSPKIFHNTTEIFSGNYWQMGPSMQTERAGLAAVVVNSEIFAIGGRYSEYKFLTSVEKLEFGEWKYVACLNIGRAGHCACVLDGKIYVAGGINLRGPVDLMEVYDPFEDQWEIIGEMRGSAEGIAMISL